MSVRRGPILLAILVLLAAAGPPRAAHASDDPLYGAQWALAKVGAPCAWQRTTGIPEVVVAVLDTGVDLGHPDLVGQLVAGYDFIDDDAEPWDEHGHGTHVAGIIAAAANNGIGVTGLAPGVRIMPVRVLDAEGLGGDSGIAAGIYYAADHGAWIINMSLGSFIPSGGEIPSAVDYALDRGVIVVIASGNEYLPLPNFAGGLAPDALVIAATDESDYKAAFSNSGPWVDLSAPGVDILSTMPTYPVYLTTERDFSEGYDRLGGTSMATPLVAAGAALVWSQHPDWSAGQVRQRLVDTTVDISEQNPEWQNPLQPLLGSGRLDVCAATAGGTAPQPMPTPHPTADQITPLPTPPDSTVELPATPSGEPTAARTTAVAETATPNPTPSRASRDDGLGPLLLLLLLGGGLVAFFLWNARRPVPAGPAPHPPSLPRPAPGPTPAAVAAPWGVLVARGGPHSGETFLLCGDVVAVGRTNDQQVRLERDLHVSRRHCRLWLRGDQAWIQDMGSAHGTSLNGARLVGDRPLYGGERIRIGASELAFHLARSSRQRR